MELEHGFTHIQENQYQGNPLGTKKSSEETTLDKTDQMI